MYYSRIFQRNYVKSFNTICTAKYSRKSAKNISAFKLVKSNNINEDVDNGEFGNNPNWELFGLKGFRFYLPGSIGPGWLDQSTTVHVKTKSIILPDDEEISSRCKNYRNKRIDPDQPVLQCIAQECPILLRKGIIELFPGCMETSSPQLTIVTITQKLNPRIRWSKEIETEKLAKYFLLAASDLCNKLKLFGYWADFINPFSGQPYFSPNKSSMLYKTDERFRCIGFKILKNNSCKVITHDTKNNEFRGSLYTSAPSNSEFFRDILNMPD
ncbi:methylmalonic aciduria and homocystinuria type D homolog, mitochondrial [Chelonus insularis]|uniref:methylmalonic aciduria and homocystinuria type D homolog, mitochondrial n=1 Tax=Chelonus insularis TaxID=460826 RepID=UPI00158CB233|nr:methylmalonic aciduria and homocystinuria type D homolog, mitochondrial [Chelonus insularis]